MNFQLHPRLQLDTIDIGHFELCRLLLMNDRHYPWFILVPERPGLMEIYQLRKTERELLIEESSYLAENLVALYKADKINIASIGNIVPQLHIHHIVRYKTDAAWPMPVWGKFVAKPYIQSQIIEHFKALGSLERLKLSEYMVS